jgi:hypothetical protein
VLRRSLESALELTRRQGVSIQSASTALTHVVSIEASEVDIWTQQIATALAIDVTT